MEPITALTDTKLVCHPAQSSFLMETVLTEPIYDIKAGTTLHPNVIRWCEGRQISPEIDNDDYLWIDLKSPLDGSTRLAWFAYAHHWEWVHDSINEEGSIILSEPDKAIAAEQAKQVEKLDPAQAEKDLGPTIVLPGLERPRHLKEPICYHENKPVNFTWAEATKNGTRIPETATITQEVIKAAKMMQFFRDEFQQTLIVTSWYRDPASNAAVGGSSQSYHMKGNAVDWRPSKDGINEASWRKLCRLHPKGGLAAGSGFFHTDTGPTRSWVYKGGPSFAKVRH